jgi:hypothetical protein
VIARLVGMVSLGLALAVCLELAAPVKSAAAPFIGSVDARSGKLPMPPSRTRKSQQDCHQVGGTWAVPALGKSGSIFSGAVQYGTNSCSRSGPTVGVGSQWVEEEPPCPGLPNEFFHLSISFRVRSSITFGGSNLFIGVKSDYLEPNTTYDVVLVNSRNDVLFQESGVSSPDGDLTVPSPFEGEFELPSGPGLFLLICH